MYKFLIIYFLTQMRFSKAVTAYVKWVDTSSVLRNTKEVYASNSIISQCRAYRGLPTCNVPELAQTVVLEAADAVALFALVTGLQVTEHERTDDHVTGD